MNRRTMIGSLLAIVMVAAPWARADTSNPAESVALTDWLSIVGTAGSEGACIYGVVTGVIRTSGEEPYVSGDSVYYDGYRNTFISSQGRDASSIRTSRRLGDFELETWPALGGSVSFTWTFEFPLWPQKHFGFAMYMANAHLEDLNIDVKVTCGSATTRTTPGSGSQAISFLDDGYGADIYGGVAGTSTITKTLSTGVVGGMSHSCQACSSEWTGPEGRAGSWSAAGSTPFGWQPIYGSGRADFVGPLGDWSWSWTGSSPPTFNGRHVLGVYAPIGDDWRFFED